VVHMEPEKLEEISRRISETRTSKFQAFIIGIAGGTASGKTTVCQMLMQALGDQRVALISLDEFYRDLTPQECENIVDVNFDEPASFDLQELVRCLQHLRDGEYAQLPVYDFVTSRRSLHQVRTVAPCDVVILEGILVLHLKETLELCNMKVFVDTDDDVRLARRIKRDTVERGRDVEGVIRQYTRFVKPSFERYILPSKNNADIIIPWRENNDVAVDLITQNIRSKLGMHDLRRIYPNLHVMPATMQTRGMHTKIRSRATPRQEFVFYADRLIRLVVEQALGYLPFAESEVTTPVGESYHGLTFSRKICGVSIIRSGEAMENALRTCCIGVKIGKILIDRVQSDRVQSGRSLHLLYEKLPFDIGERHVLLMDPILASGQSCASAIEVLTKRRSVREDKIILITLIAAPEGIHHVCKKFPAVKVITTEIDEGVDGAGTVLPGIGNFGDRYFGTGSAADEPVRLLSGNLSALNSEKGSSTSNDASNSHPRGSSEPN
ncbi:UKL2, partial [Symbiodinium pilosum]